MPVVTTTVVTGGASTTVTYTVNVAAAFVKHPPRVRPWPSLRPSVSANYSGISIPTYSQILRFKNVPTPNSGTIGAEYIPISEADGYGVRLAPVNNNQTIVSTVGNNIPTVFKFYYSDGFVAGQSYPTTIYYLYVPDPAKMPRSCCLEVDLGAPFGTIRLIYDGGTVIFSAATPPGGWVRNAELRNSSGCAGSDSVQISATGAQMLSTYWMGVFTTDGSSWGRNGGFLDSTVPTFKLNFPGLFGFGSLYGRNYQTSTYMRSNVTMKGRWRKLIHNDHSTYYPQPGPYLGASFNIAFTDLSVAPNDGVQMSPTFGQTLTAPPLPANEYCGLYLELTGTSDCVNFSGVPYMTTYTETQPVVNVRASSIPTIEYSYSGPSYWPWDVVQNGLGVDDATVRWVRHAGYRPLDSSFPPALAETIVAPSLTRVGKVIILQGGTPSYSGTLPYITAATPACTAVVFTTDPTQSNGSQMTTSMAMRVVSMEWGVAWGTSTTLAETSERVSTTNPALTGVWRQVYNANYLIGSTYQGGPGVLMNDLCALVNNANGAAGNVAITSPQYTYPSLRGMEGGGAATPARGRIWLTANPIDGYKITLGDGALTKTFEFDSNAAVVAGNAAVTIGASVDATTAALVAAINSSGLAITASVPTITDLKVEITLCRSAGQSGGFRQSSQRWTVAAP